MQYKFVLLFVVILTVIKGEEVTFGQGRISNGKTAVNGQFPYQAGIEIYRRWGKFWCGGALIHQEWILTAAHCMKDALGARIFLGDIQRGSSKVNFYVPGPKILLHSQFNDNNMHNDIALLKLPESVELSENIKTVNISKADQAYEIGEPLIISGWGDIGDNLGAAKVLQFAQISIADPSLCLRNFGSYYFTGNNICTASTDYVSACRGDSGGPAVLKDNTTLVGLVSFGSSFGCSKGYPVAFTKISSFRHWIELVTGIQFE